MLRTYTELCHLHSFEERFKYLRLYGIVGESTFGYDRYINQLLYTSKRWKAIRDGVIIRDEGCDLGMEGYEIHDKILIHHMNPITLEDIEKNRPIVFNPQFLICSSHMTHNAIHYGDVNLLPEIPITRRSNDMCPWR